MLEGQKYTNDEIADMYDKCFDLDEDNDNEVDGKELKQDLVVESGINIFSHCEHHLALMYDMSVTIAYIPNTKVIGLSKMARIAEMVGKRLQLQEKNRFRYSLYYDENTWHSRCSCINKRKTWLYDS